MTADWNMETAICLTRKYREKLLSDPWRPGYHFAVPDDIGMPGDPNGAFFARGRYHLMYLYHRRGEKFFGNSCFCWGHVSSIDMVHWRHHRDALAAGGPDGGIFSGGAFVDDDGTAYLTYWALPIHPETGQGAGIGIARSSDDAYEHWEKIALIPSTEMGILEITDDQGRPLPLACADPSNIWKKDGVYYLQAGNLPVLNRFGRSDQSPAQYRGDWTDLYKSDDLIHWQPAGRFYQRKADNSWTDETEDDMCPSFLPLPRRADGGPASGKYLQLFIAHNKGCQYYIGEYDQHNDRFLPESHGRMSWTDNTYFAPEALIDGQGRQIIWAWLLDNPKDNDRTLSEDGWTGVFGLPRSVWLAEDGTLGLAPVPELAKLRYNEKSFPSQIISDDQTVELIGINGESCEIILDITPETASEIGLKVRTSPDEEEMTRLAVDRVSGSLVFDAAQSGICGRTVRESAPFCLGEQESLHLHIFIDRSVIEVFANNRQAITRRVYPGRADSTRIILCCKGGTVRFDRIQTWAIMPANPY